MNVFELVKKEAESRKLTIQEVEKLAGISNGSISKWGKSVPKADRLHRVAVVFDLPIEYFLTDGTPALNFLSDKDERELLFNYRLLDDRGKHKLHTISYEELDRIESTECHPRPIPFAASGEADITPESYADIQIRLQKYDKRAKELEGK